MTTTKKIIAAAVLLGLVLFLIPMGIRYDKGVPGGGTEAVLRKIASDNSRTTLSQIEYVGVRGMEDMKEATVNYGGRELHIAVVSGLANARKVLKAIKSGEMHYDLVEVMEMKRSVLRQCGIQMEQPKPLQQISAFFHLQRVHRPSSSR